MPYEVKRERCVSCGERLPADIVDIGSQLKGRFNVLVQSLRGT